MKTIIDIHAEIDGQVEVDGTTLESIAKDGSFEEYSINIKTLNGLILLLLRIKWAVISKQVKGLAGDLWVCLRYLLGFIFAGLGFFALMCDLADDNAWRLFVVLKIIALPLLSISFWLFTGASVKQAINDTCRFFRDLYRDIKGLFS